MLSRVSRYAVTHSRLVAAGLRGNCVRAVVATPGTFYRLRPLSTTTVGSSAGSREKDGAACSVNNPEGCKSFEEASHEFFPTKNAAAETKADQLAVASHADTPHFKRDAAHVHPLVEAGKMSAWEIKRDNEEFTSYALPHPVWDEKAASEVEVTHHKPKDVTEHLAYASVTMMRLGFDVLSGYKFGKLDERGWLNRIVFLETVAGVPGMVGAMVRHLNSLRKMQRDYGWIHTLLEEAENERMHLMTALILKKPGPVFRFGVLMTQGIFLTMYSLSYLISPRFCHRFVGYLEEEAVKTYSRLLKEMDEGHLPLFSHMPAPPVAVDYWQLPETAKLRDVWLAIRADESHHRDVNHTFAAMRQDDPNPFPPGH
uniref:Alternative oxidase n=1 Tax=Chromera velia CCMP2878 TaxID=1169474 RepID=A0A0G4HE94_9ALVE|mmetsp:Transcript_38366/g.75322  ORF Transcript_38366/g.75322 Transcript_38366/m.75322 type:complete len:370 (-) Transcript_38366:1648-2757(-)|eukprot:Cvel_6529.t1-p1 / transcript=Cvel_6529.t1 / gene=Cvel_6529 / organism=Chromera_velia_CCMP2878 / gene_product=Alternative oxidase, mitochondrial, putative / transcript_product=Alternative oxidase, mitochondrial, putative / location=Cvel_scaffold321:50483-53220(-) / protein_length=369 / sequence_SO=supercontig / SO=protein_coding / is_pseudo=false